ncbi:hypothetical protein [Amphritea sp. HPY]|uniref:hypothetical protein n=1 Tax=Amphritea sp. HPY TaxID=3421652 RepID=UPI003D7E27BE
MRKLYLHIGTEKTGTTSIQEFLYSNKKALSKSGYHVLQCAGKKNHRAIPSYCMSENSYDDFYFDRQIDNLEKKRIFKKKLYNSFVKEINSLSDNIHSVIITSEHFHSRLKTLEEVAAVKDLVSPFFTDIEIICYLREQSDLASSLYSTGIKSGSNIDFSSFLERCSPDNTYYNYYSFLNRWSNVFPSESLSVRVFSKGSFYNNDLIDDFCFGINEDLLSKVDRKVNIENESLSNFGKVIGRAVNSVSPKYNGDGSVNKSRANALRRVASSFGGHESNLSIEQYNTIYKSFLASNVKVANEYLKSSDPLFPSNPPAASNKPLNEIQVADLAKIILDVKGIAQVSDQDAVLFRDAAILLENIDINIAYRLMRLAQLGRPKGPFIKSKLEEYESRL